MKLTIALTAFILVSGCSQLSSDLSLLEDSAKRDFRAIADKVGITTSYDPSACEGECLEVETGAVE